MKPADLISKAVRALASAKLLVEAGDVDGACNRAYYAMFDAARAALLLSDAPAEMAEAKTHSGLISAFSLHLVKTKQFPIELGKALNRAAEIRLVADYTGDEVTMDKARWVTEQAILFVGEVEKRFKSPPVAINNDDQ